MSFLLGRMIEKQTMCIQIWVLGKYFLENKWSEAVTSRKTTEYLLPITLHFQIKMYVHLQFEDCICHYALDSFPILKDYSDEIGDISKGDFSIL